MKNGDREMHTLAGVRERRVEKRGKKTGDGMDENTTVKQSRVLLRSSELFLFVSVSRVITTAFRDARWPRRCSQRKSSEGKQEDRGAWSRRQRDKERMAQAHALRIPFIREVQVRA